MSIRSSTNSHGRRRTVSQEEDDSSVESNQTSSSSSMESKRRRIVRKTIGNLDLERNAAVEYSKGRIELEPCGTIERIILKNVFCHEHLDFNGFKLNINLLQGANGSGKSSIVAAIIAGLGGSSKATDRAQNIKSIIKNGKTSASIEIHLKNKGPLAYKPDTFGDSIIVERRIVASGSSSYKIMDQRGSAVSTKKDDLNKLLDSFNLQVDNPVLFLSQERAKTFLSGTKPSDLFEFYMRATQLRQWQDDYKFKKVKLDEAAKIVTNKSEDLPQLEKEVKKWEKKVQAISSLQEKRGMLSHLRKAKAWAEVIEEENALKVLQANKAKIDAKLNDVAEAMQKVEKKRDELKQKRKAYDEEVVETSTHIKHWESELTKRRNVVTEAKTRLRQHVAERKALEMEKSECEQDMRSLKEKLQRDSDEMTAQWQATVKELEEKKMAQVTKSQKVEEAIGREQEDIQALSRNLQEAQEEFNHCDLQTKAIKSRRDALERELKGMHEGRKDRLTVFGQFVPLLVREIEMANKRGLFTAKPIGPLGSYIKVRDSSWTHIVEAVTRGLLNAFLVSSGADLKQLSRIMDKAVPKGQPRPQIIVSEFRDRMHDTSRFETASPPYFSLWSVLDVENIQVANALLDQLQVESILLVPTADEAANLLTEQRNVPNNCVKAMTLHGDTYFPDPNYRIYSGRGDKRVRFLQVSIEDKIRDLRQNLESTRTEVESSQIECAEKARKVQQMKRMKEGANKKLDTLQREIITIKRKIQEIINSAPPPPPDVAHMRNELKENERLKMDVEKKLENLKENMKADETELAQKSEHLQEAQKECEKMRSTLEEHESKTSAIDQQLVQKEKEMLVLKNTKAKITTLGGENEEKLNEKAALVQAKETEILKVHPVRIEPEKSKKELEMEYIAMKNAIEREEALHGSLEEISSTFRIKKQKYEKLQREVKIHKAFVSEWTDTLASREGKYRSLKKMTSMYLCTTFQNLIGKRKLVGKIEIDYKKHSLKIMMKKDTGDQSHQLQSLQMMSGGERSFATVSFILSLWHVVSSPIRIMDEFEIFMDVVSRKQCMQMIIEASKPNQQYILVSPLENKEKSEKLHVFRMPDPERRGRGSVSEEI